MKRGLLALLVVAAALCAACASDPKGQTGDSKTGAKGEISGVSVGGGTSIAPGTDSGNGEAGACPNGCITPPPGCLIKGNINIRTGQRVYHMPGQKHYNDVTIETESGERWFCTEDEAEANGWRRARK
jgi:hypothetical protein